MVPLASIWRTTSVDAELITTLAPWSVSCAAAVRNTLREGLVDPFAVLTAVVPMSAMTGAELVVRSWKWPEASVVADGSPASHLPLSLRSEQTLAPW